MICIHTFTCKHQQMREGAPSSKSSGEILEEHLRKSVSVFSFRVIQLWDFNWIPNR